MFEKIRIALVGVLMGAAEVVPGVSGGTIAFVMGVYERLILSVRHMTPMLVADLFRSGIPFVWKKVDATFMLILFGFMGLSVIVFARGITYMMQEQPVLLWAYFFGLVLASSWIVGHQIGRFTARLGICTFLGAVFGVLVTSVVPVNLPPTPLFIFLGGAVAVCAWILPGISGSFILLILGLYGVILEAIHSLDLVTLGALGAGCAIGLVTFAQLLSWLFSHHREPLLSVLMGFMLGSLTKLWPWKETLSYQLGSDGRQIPLEQNPVSPQVWFELTGSDPQIGLAIIAVLLGLVSVIALDKLAFGNSDSTSAKTGM
ncbi:MAG: DUF368 domain-containing protein [Pseudomonadales bacterium]|nr:DUF368 domain-containing protein [Pseudomonadales bacterium]